jgi:hypothetical protein
MDTNISEQAVGTLDDAIESGGHEIFTRAVETDGDTIPLIAQPSLLEFIWAEFL